MLSTSILNWLWSVYAPKNKIKDGYLDRVSTKAIINNLSNTWDTTPKICYPKRMAESKYYVAQVRLRDIYIDLGGSSGYIDSVRWLYTINQIKRCKIKSRFESHIVNWVNRNHVPDDAMIQLHVFTQYRDFRPGEWIYANPYAWFITTVDGVSGSVYVNLNNAAVYSMVTISIIDKVMTQVCDKTNTDVGNHVRLMLGICSLSKQ